MKKLAIFILFLSTVTAAGQRADSTVCIIDCLESAPTFSGGDEKLFCFFESNLDFDILNSTELNTRYLVRFIIDTIGYPTNIKFMEIEPHFENHSPEDSLIRREILRVFKLMPAWVPARVNGTKVPYGYVIPFDIPYYKFYCGYLNQVRNVEYKPDIPAEFIFGQGKTGHERMINYLGKHLKWPSQDDCQGKVIIKCVINKSGKPCHFEIVHRLCPDFDNEAMRVVKKMPKWKPAIKNNKKVRSIAIIPVAFKITM
jgi:hypothetical protein